VLFDVKSQPFFGAIPAKLGRNSHMEVDVPIASELLHQTVTVVGTHALGGALTIAGTLLTNSQTLANTTRQSLDRVNVGAIELRRGADRERVARELSAMLPADVRVYSKQSFIELERSYWSTETPIGFLFDLGAIIGFVIAGIYISQVLFQIVEENLPQYALLKSMGYPPSFFVALVMITAAILALIAIPVAVAAAEVVYHVCVRATLLDIKLTIVRVGAVSAIILLISMMAALVASRRLNRADPATLL
jgi:putative ABC transport system permease protein